MKKTYFMMVISMFLTTNLYAEPSLKLMSKAEVDCRTWAEEDGISPSDMKEFIISCLKETKGEIGNKTDSQIIQTNSETTVDSQHNKFGEK
ncbi:MAG: hypothetical protein HQL69_11350 [Magnetococcales bacterium]|nr:hypothetical protein [Magnetococcales bacterium]